VRRSPSEVPTTALDLPGLPAGGWTRFAPAPTGYLHLGHVANAVWTWGVARVTGGRVLLRIEDHDRARSRPEYDAALLEDLDWLGFAPDAGPVRQTDPEALNTYGAALARLHEAGLVYGCDCTRATFERWAAANSRTWSGPGCPGGCVARGLTGPVLRVTIGGGSEAWDDAAEGACEGPVTPSGDPPISDRDGNWTYGFCVVVDDLRQEVDLVVRGRDLLDATPTQIRLSRLLGRAEPPAFLHHPLILRPDGSKLSKSSNDTGIRELRAAGWSPEAVRSVAAERSGFPGRP
jgi:glutamyl/glutaminyl-tRNA synthetase